MKIAYDSQIFWMQKYGGISRYFINLYQNVRMAGHDAFICSSVHINQYLKNLKCGLYIDKLPFKSGRLIGLFNSGLSDLLIARSKPDLVHRTYYFHRQRLNIPQVLTVYDLIHEKFPVCFAKSDKTVAYKKNAIKNSDHIICISKSTQNDLINYYNVEEKKISVIHLGFELQNFDLCKNVVFSLNAPFLLFVGNRDGYKNFDGFIKAVASSSILRRLSVVCFGGGKFSKQEMAYINSYGLDNSKFLQIFGEDALLGELYSKALAFVYPSKYEGFGLPPLEAMSKGCPVICSNASSIPEVVGQAGEYFDPYSLDSIRIAIERVIFDDSRRIELQNLGYARVRNFTWERCAQQTLKIYERIM